MLETDSLMYNINETKQDDVDEFNLISADLSKTQHFNTVDYVKEEEVECEEVFDSVYFTDNSSRKSSYYD